MMKRKSILSTIFLGFVLSACSFNTNPSPKTDNTAFTLKKNIDYLAIASRKQQLHIVEAKTRKIVQTCNLVDEYGPGALVISEDGKKAYLLQNNMQAIYGYDIQTCKNFFQAHFTKKDIRGIAVLSIAVSKDGKEVYTIYNPTRMKSDRYEVLEPRFAVFNTADGLNAKAIREFKAPRQTTIMSIAHDNDVYTVGKSLYKINPKTGKIKVAAKLRHWDKQYYSPPDSLAMWPIGKVSNEFMIMYTAAKFPNDKFDMNEAEFVWGATRVDLTTGEIEQEDFAPLETIMFTGMTDPRDSNILYGALTDLTKFDRKNKKVIKRVDLDHTYYSLNLAHDGSEIYISGTLNDIVVYDSNTLEKIGKILLPDGDTGAGTLQVFQVR